MDDFLDITPTELEGKVVAKLYVDAESESPRVSFDHAGTLVYDPERSDFDLSDKGAHLPITGTYSSDRSDVALSARYVELQGGVALLAQIQDYGSSGARCYDAADCADVANALFWIDKETIEKEWTAFGTPDPKAAALACLKAECEELDQYLSGDVFGYSIETPDGEFLDSCWGFYGLKYATEAGTEAAQSAAQEIDNRADHLAAARAWAFRTIFGKES